MLRIPLPSAAHSGAYIPEDDGFALAKHVRQSMYLRSHETQKKGGYAAGKPVDRGRKKSRTTRTSTTSRTRIANLSIVIRYNEAVFLISKELLKRCPTRAAALVGPA